MDDRKIAVIVADGAGAVVVEPAEGHGTRKIGRYNTQGSHSETPAAVLGGSVWRFPRLILGNLRALERRIGSSGSLRGGGPFISAEIVPDD